MPSPARPTGRSLRLWRVAPVGCVLVAVVHGGWSAGADPGPGNESVSQSQPSGPGEVADIYRRDCAVCHGADAEGTRRGPALAGSGLALVDYMIRTGRMPIDEPGDEIERSDPAYDPATIDSLVAYTGNLQDGAVADGPALPRVDPARGDVSAGGEVWRHECAACHAWSGNGGGMLERPSPDVRNATPEEMAAAVRSGPLTMPRFGPAAVSHRELDSLAAFFEEELKAQQDPGGWPIGHIGPVAEGGIALAVGLGLLTVITRLMGSGRESR